MACSNFPVSRRLVVGIQLKKFFASTEKEVSDFVKESNRIAVEWKDFMASNFSNKNYFIDFDFINIGRGFVVLGYETPESAIFRSEPSFGIFFEKYDKDLIIEHLDKFFVYFNDFLIEMDNRHKYWKEVRQKIDREVFYELNEKRDHFMLHLEHYFSIINGDLNLNDIDLKYGMVSNICSYEILPYNFFIKVFEYPENMNFSQHSFVKQEKLRIY